MGAVFDHERGADSRGIVIEEDVERVQEFGEEHAAGTEHAKAFRPHRAHVLGEDIRDGMKDEIEAAIVVGRLS